MKKNELLIVMIEERFFKFIYWW